jgi:hypothetical protein
MYRVHGTRLRRWTIGRYPTLSLADAREKMKMAAGGLAKSGVDPAATKIQDRASKTIGDLAHEYLTKQCVQLRLACSVGDSPTGGKVRNLRSLGRIRGGNEPDEADRRSHPWDGERVTGPQRK